jgi:hypothetical protein
LRVYKGQIRTIKTHYLTSADGALITVIKHIHDYNFKTVKVIRYSDDNGYHHFVMTSPASISKKKQAWIKAQGIADAAILEEDPNIGITGIDGEDVEELHEDAAAAEPEGDVDGMNMSGGGRGGGGGGDVDGMNMSGGGGGGGGGNGGYQVPNNTPRTAIQDRKLYLRKKWCEPLELGKLDSVAQNKIILDIVIVCMEEIRDKIMKSDIKYQVAATQEERNPEAVGELGGRGGVVVVVVGGGGDDQMNTSGGGGEVRTAPAGGEKPPITFFFDGDHPQIEALMQHIIDNRLAKDDKIDCFKFPGGCTMMFQPNDLSKSFSILKAYFKQLRGKNIIKPAFYDQMKHFLKHEGMQASSLNTFMNYFMHVLTMEQKAFPKATIQSGWGRAGLCPFSIEVILNSNPSYASLPIDSKQFILDSLPLLHDYAEVNGRVDENDMIRQLGQKLLNTTVENIQHKPINQQRAVILTNDQTMLLRLETQKRRNDKEAAEKQKKEKANQAKLKRDQAVEDLKKACLQGPPFFGGNRSAENKSCMNCTCGNNVVVLDPQNTDEKWIGCPQECGYWSCYLVTCQKMMDKHRQICHLRLFP